MEATLFVFIEPMKAENIGHALRLGDGSARGENRDHSATDFDVFCAAKRFESQLGKIGAKPLFALPMGNHWFGV